MKLHQHFVDDVLGWHGVEGHREDIEGAFVACAAGEPLRQETFNYVDDALFVDVYDLWYFISLAEY